MNSAPRDEDLLPAVERLRAALQWLSEGLLERDDHARALLLAALSGEHILLIGPPGTAKSALARRLHQLVGGRWFERLLTRFTVPEELFGPLSLAALDEGRYERELEGYLPTADVAFLDEVFKANSAILNSLLGILNERVFDQGASRIAVPLACLVGASNELPDDEVTRAFQDRFLFRCHVAPVSDSAFRNLLTLESDEGQAPPWQISRATLDHIDTQAASVVLSDALLDALVALRARLLEAGLTVSDRRWVRAVRVLRVAALIDRSGEAGLEYLPVLRWLLPVSPAQVAAFEQWMLGYLGVDRRLEPAWLERAVQAFAQQLEIEQSAGELAFDDSGKLAMARQVGGADPSALSADAPRLSAFSRARRYSRAHIDARVAQISALIGRVDSWLAEADDQSRALQSRLGRVLWLGHGVAQAAGDTFEASMASVRSLRVRLESVRAGFTGLPLADLDNGLTPEPVNLDEVL
jgi:MoxR-like ATPase